MTEDAAPLAPEQSIVEFAESLQTQDAEPATEAQEAPPVEPEGLPDLSKIHELAGQRAKERDDQTRTMAPVREMMATLEERLAALPSGPVLSLEALQADPIAALRAGGVDVAALQKTLTKSQLGPDPADQVSALLDAKLAPLLKLMAPPTAEPAGHPPEALSEAKDAFAAHVDGAATDYPVLSRLPAKVRAEAAWDYVVSARNAGYDTSTWTNDQIAAKVERQLAPGPTPPANGGTQTPAPGPQTAAHGGDPSVTRSISNSLAATVPREPPKGRAAILADVTEFAKSLPGME